jgi:N-acetyl-anhydromuramoyl-L-alanine amidase
VIKVSQPAGIMDVTRYQPSPNHDARPAGVAVDTLVIHSISLPPGEFGSRDIEGLFCNDLRTDAHPFYESICQLTVSSHLLIRRDGSVIQFVPFGERAWHAGVSEFVGRTRVNDFSIGIELEGSDFGPYEEQQYQALIAVTQDIRHAYPDITPERVVGHSQIAPQRKTDPGPYFNWTRYRQSMR